MSDTKIFTVRIPQQWNASYRIEAPTAKEAFKKCILGDRPSAYCKEYVSDIDTELTDCDVEEW